MQFGPAPARDLQVSDGFPEGNLMFAYTALHTFLEANDAYMHLSGGDHIHNAGVELYASAEIAKSLVLRKATIDGIETGFACLEVTGGRVHGELASRNRYDIGLVARDLPDRDPLEVFCVIEVKRHFNESKRDVAKVAELLKLHRQEGWPIERAVIIGADSTYQSTTKDTIDRLQFYMQDLRERHPDLRFEIAFLKRDNLFRSNPANAWSAHHVLGFTAYCIVVRL